MFRNNQQPAPNPWTLSQGHTDALPGFFGLGVIGAMDPVQAVTAMEYESEEPTEVEGYTTIWPQVIDWPFDEDEAGAPFDRANLYGIRTRCIRLPLADGGGDDDYWTAVPKTLPEGYTSVGRCGILAPLFADHLGDPFESIFWRHRTASGYIPDPDAADFSSRSQWGPRNRNQKVMNFDLSFGYILSEGAMNVWEYIPQALLATDHIGFRSAKFTVTVINPGFGPTYPYTVNRTIKVYCIPATAEPWTVVEDPPAEKQELGSFNINFTHPSTGAPGTVLEFTLTGLTPSANGIVHNFFAYADPIGDPALGEELIFITINVQLSPRTDVPAWFFASTGNRCAPGGIISP